MRKLLDYTATPPRQRWYSTQLAKTVGVVCVTLLAIVLIPIGSYRYRSYSVDAVTGSATTQTTYCFGITTGPVMEVSSLEKRMKALGITWTPNPVFCGASGSDLIGLNWGRECGSSPSIASLGPMMDDYVAQATDAEVIAFVQVMQTGTDNQQNAAVEAAFDEVADGR